MKSEERRVRENVKRVWKRLKREEEGDEKMWKE